MSQINPRSTAIRDDDYLNIIPSTDGFAASGPAKHKKKHDKVVPVLDVGDEQTNDVSSQKLGDRVKPQLQQLGRRKKGANEKETVVSSTNSAQNRLRYMDYLQRFFFDRRSMYLAAPFCALGLFSASVLELFPSVNFKMDILLLLVMSASLQFPYFDLRSVRPQLILSVFVLGSFGWNIYSLVRNDANRIAINFFVSLLMLSKVAVFVAYLRHTKGAPRVRKYLHRRFRLFLFPFQQPKRLMRDIRGRMLALAWIHAVSLILYSALLIVLWTVLDYNIYMLSTLTSNYLPWMLIAKIFTVGLCLLGLLYDTDIRLCFLHFGCCVFTMKYARKYIRQRIRTLGGYPLAFSFYRLRFSIWQCCKVLDILCGVGLWAVLVMNGRAARNMEVTVYAYLASLAFVLCLSDLWSTLITLGIRWLLYRHKILSRMPSKAVGATAAAVGAKEEKRGGDEIAVFVQTTIHSDDSELDDFNLRCRERSPSSEDDENDEETEMDVEAQRLLGAKKKRSSKKSKHKKNKKNRENDQKEYDLRKPRPTFLHYLDDTSEEDGGDTNDAEAEDRRLGRKSIKPTAESDQTKKRRNVNQVKPWQSVDNGQEDEDENGEHLGYVDDREIAVDLESNGRAKHSVRQAVKTKPAGRYYEAPGSHQTTPSLPATKRQDIVYDNADGDEDYDVLDQRIDEHLLAPFSNTNSSYHDLNSHRYPRMESRTGRNPLHPSDIDGGGGDDEEGEERANSKMPRLLTLVDFKRMWKTTAAASGSQMLRTTQEIQIHLEQDTDEIYHPSSRIHQQRMRAQLVQMQTMVTSYLYNHPLHFSVLSADLVTSLEESTTESHPDESVICGYTYLYDAAADVVEDERSGFFNRRKQQQQQEQSAAAVKTFLIEVRVLTLAARDRLLSTQSGKRSSSRLLQEQHQRSSAVVHALTDYILHITLCTPLDYLLSRYVGDSKRRDQENERLRQYQAYVLEALQWSQVPGVQVLASFALPS